MNALHFNVLLTLSSNKKNLLNSTDLIFKCNTLTFVYRTSSVNYPCGALKRLQSV